MFNNVKLGIAPIGWTNDDMPQLGGELTFEQMVSEAALAGFQGTEVGGKFPTNPAVLNKALDLRGIKIASQWFSSFLCSTPCISGTQKCISAPSGSALITYNEQIEEIVKKRKKVEKGIRTADDVNGSLAGIPSNYLDLAQLEDYWSPRRLNHHTEATSMQYAVHEALRCIVDETLEARWARHSLNDKALCAGLNAMGLSIFGDIEHKMPVVTAINIPEGVDGKVIRGTLLNEFGIEIATSFGPLDGKILRIGNMGYSSQKRNILILLGALEAVMLQNHVKIATGEGVAAAMEVYKNAEK